MSLQVWLPFTKDLYNQGLGNLSAITLASGNTLSANGKLGGQTLTLTKLQTILPTSSCMTGAKEMSYAFWVKVNTAWETQWLDGIRWVSTDGSATHTSRQEFYTNCTKVGTWFQGSSISGKDFTPEVWTHIAGTFNYNTGEAKFYLNGILQGTSTALATTHYCRGDFYIGDNGVNISENDVRIYDHCLSDKEIEELAKGLVLHYRLDSINNNLLYTMPKSITPTSYTAYQLNMTENLEANQTYTLQLWDVDVYHSEKTAAQTGVWVYWGGGSVNLLAWSGLTYFTQDGATNYHADHLTRTFTVTSANASGSGATNAWLNIYNSVGYVAGTMTMHIGGWKLTKDSINSLPSSTATEENIIYDSSGYGNNGIVIGDIQIDTNSPRNSYSIKQANGQYIRVEKRPAECMPKDAITVSLWQYATSWYNPISCTEGGGWNFENSGGIRFPVYISGVGYKVPQSTVTPASTQNAWHMLTGTMDKDNVKIYYDGVEVGTVANGSTNGIGYANNYIFIGGEAQGNNTAPASSAYVGNLSDVRIYATALTPAQILELYHTSATIDNKGNAYGRELVEK